MSIQTRTVQVLPGTAVTVLALGLLPGEQLTISYAIDLGCKPALAQYEPTSECCDEFIIEQARNPVTLWRPGWYRIDAVGVINANASLSISDPFPVTTTMDGNACCPPAGIAGITIEPDGRITIILTDGRTITTVTSVIIPPLIAAVFNDCEDNDMTPDTQIARCSDIPTDEEIAGIFRDCNGAQLVPGAQVAMCSDLMPDDAGSPPPTNEAPNLPTTLYGPRTALLGQPAGWLDFGGKKVPYWN